MAVVIKFVRIIQEVSAVRASMASCYNQTGKHAKVRAQIYSTSEQVLTRSQKFFWSYRHTTLVPDEADTCLKLTPLAPWCTSVVSFITLQCGYI